MQFNVVRLNFHISDCFQIVHLIRNELHITEQRGDNVAKSFQAGMEMLDVDHDWTRYGHFHL